MGYSGIRRRAAANAAAVVGAVGMIGVCAIAPAAGASAPQRPAAAALTSTVAGSQHHPWPASTFPPFPYVSYFAIFAGFFPYPLPFPLPFEEPSLSFDFSQGKGAPSTTTAGPCRTLLVLVNGRDFPPALHGAGQLDLYDAHGTLLDYEDYSWNPQGPQSQVLAVVPGTVLEPALGTATRLVTAVVAGHSNVSAIFPLECTP